MNNFESHLANIVMKNQNTGRNRYVGFFDILQSIYSLQGPAVYTYSHTIFDTWSPVDASDSLRDAMSYSIHRLDSDEDDAETAINTPEIVPVLVEHTLHPNVAVRRRQVHAPSSKITRPEPSGDDAVVINIDEDVTSPRLSALGSTPESPIKQAGPYNLPIAQKPQLAEPVIIS